MAWTSTDLDRINAAIASGVKRVKFSDREVEYQSIDDMKKARELIRRELGLSTSSSGKKYASFSKGFD